MGTSNDAEQAAKKSEKARQSQIAGSTARINSVFDAPERQTQYANFGQALRDFYTTDANKQKTIADRNSKFALAKAGLTGGSAAVDAGRTLSEDYQKGIIQAERKAQEGVANLQNADQQSRLNLTQLAQQGADATTVGRQAADSLRTAAQGAESTALTGGLGDIFGSTATLYNKQNQAAKDRAQLKQYQSLYAPSPYAPSAGAV